MDNQTKKLLIIAGAGVGAYFLYQYLFPTTAAASTAASSVPATTALTQTQETGSLPSSTPVMTNAAGVVLDQSLYNWLLAHTQPWYGAFFANVFPKWTQADVTTMDQILVQYSTATPLSGALLQFWNTWFPSGYPLGY